MTTSNRRNFPETSPKVNFPQLEEDNLRFWNQKDVFKRSISQRKDAGAKDYVFYDGPPFATGLPHYGHIMTGYIKDSVPRYFTMRGRAVERRFGWDCHGLPIENEIEKELGISGKRQIEELGIEKFNTLCSEAVLRYTREWEEVMTRLGRWVDFDNDYKTMDLSYMESVMGVFHALWEKELIYEGNKVVPYCYRCQTPISNFEARMDDSFRGRQDPSLTLRFEVLNTSGDRKEYILAWTTTPWTLPSNIALAVGPEILYDLVEAEDGDYWIAQERRSGYERELKDYPTIRTAPGSELVGKKYKPLLPYYEHLAAEGGFRVVSAKYVSIEDGTGVVHTAPAFGEDDAETGHREGLPHPNPVDHEGKFNSEIHDFEGRNVHDANKDIIKLLKDRGSLVRHETLEHNYPHCWRDDSPLIYKTVPTWYLNVTKIKEKMIAANRQINWVPAHIQEGRFGKWLEGARDWAISRSRFWGAPIPVWRCDKSGEFYVPASVAELSAKWGKPVTDLHRPNVDKIEFPSPAGGTFRRVPEVLDCWFESGSMPYAQVHYPYENKEWFEKNFPADFIVEYIAQTRGWFYTLVVLSAALFDKPPFSNVICHGVVLAEDGRKMSKRLKNYPDPMDIVNEFGSDALRISLLATPVMRGENMRFARREVEDAMRAYLIPLWNSYHFFATYANIDGWTPGNDAAAFVASPANESDRYILAKLETLREKVEASTESYDIVSVYDALKDFIERLNNWYIRISRPRFWSGEDTTSKNAAYGVLFTVLRKYTMIAAPYFPFITESIYQGLCGAEESVHLQDWPAPAPEFVNPALVRDAETVQHIIYLGRQIRESKDIKVRQPLQSLQVAGIDPALLEAYRAEITGELNVKQLLHLADPAAVVSNEIKPNSKVLGPKFGARFKDVLAAAKAGKFVLGDDGIARFEDMELVPGDFTAEFKLRDPESGCASSGGVIVVLSLTVTRDLMLEGISRDLIRFIQDMRKKEGLAYTDRIALRITSDNADVSAAIDAHGAHIAEETLARKFNDAHEDARGGFESTVEVGGASALIAMKVMA
jgi:isoleucyl-tRNA synthetase